jgi:hypothetical protein
MNKFVKNLTLTLLTFFLTANVVNANDTKVEKIRNETIAFIDNLNTSLPKMIQDINSSKMMLNAKILKTIVGTYKEVRLMELIKAMLPLKRNNLDDRLLPLAGYLAIEALILKSISNLKAQKSSDKNSKLNKKIKGYEKEIKDKAAILRATLNDCLIKFLHLPESLNNLDLKKTKATHDIKEILEALSYKSLPEILEIKGKKLKEEFYENVQKNASCLLTPADQTVLKGFVASDMFKKMKNTTTAGTFTTFSNGMLSSLPATAQDLIKQAREKILVA